MCSKQKLKLSGIDVRSRHVKAWSSREKPSTHQSGSNTPPTYPREVTVHIRHFFNERLIYRTVSLAAAIPTTRIMKQDNAQTFTGIACSKIMVEKQLLQKRKTASDRGRHKSYCMKKKRKEVEESTIAQQEEKPGEEERVSDEPTKGDLALCIRDLRRETKQTETVNREQQESDTTQLESLGSVRRN